MPDTVGAPSKADRNIADSRATAPSDGVDTVLNRGRRGLLVGAFAASASASVALINGAPNTETLRDRGSVSYRETEHIREAYRRMRF